MDDEPEPISDDKLIYRRVPASMHWFDPMRGLSARKRSAPTSNAIDLKPFVTGTAQPKMNQAKMNSIPIALPPLSEQKRIISKVTEPLSRCDALEAKLTQAEFASPQLLSAAVAHLLQENLRAGEEPRRETTG